MHTVDVSLPSDGYPIHIGRGLLAQIPDLFDLGAYSQIGIVTDENVAPHWLASLEAALPKACTGIVMPAGERHKTVETIRMIWERLLREGFDRSALLMDLGGGVVGDVGGFAASTYMRGIDFLQVPTSLLAMVDASVGGKVGVDEAGAKNLVGAFAQPIGVVVDTTTLSTLPAREYRAGFAEILKHGLIRDAEYFEELPAELVRTGESPQLAAIIRRSCEIKSAVVTADERENGLRKILNFGHTVGHALEIHSLSWPEPLLHGEAVSLGMVAAARLSYLEGSLSDVEAAVVERRLAEFGLPVVLPEATIMSAVLERLWLDKKKRGERIAWTLLDRIGQASPDRAVETERVTEVLASMRGDE